MIQEKIHFVIYTIEIVVVLCIVLFVCYLGYGIYVLINAPPSVTHVYNITNIVMCNMKPIVPQSPIPMFI